MLILALGVEGRDIPCPFVSDLNLLWARKDGCHQKTGVLVPSRPGGEELLDVSRNLW